MDMVHLIHARIYAYMSIRVMIFIKTEAVIFLRIKREVKLFYKTLIKYRKKEKLLPKLQKANLI